MLCWFVLCGLVCGALGSSVESLFWVAMECRGILISVV